MNKRRGSRIRALLRGALRVLTGIALAVMIGLAIWQGPAAARWCQATWRLVNVTVRTSPFYAVRHVAYRGNDMIPTDVLRRAVERELPSSIWGDFSPAVKALGQVPGLLRFRIDRSPPGTVVVSVIEDRAIGWTWHQGAPRVVTAGGALLPPGSRAVVFHRLPVFAFPAGAIRGDAVQESGALLVVQSIARLDSAGVPWLGRVRTITPVAQGARLAMDPPVTYTVLVGPRTDPGIAAVLDASAADYMARHGAKRPLSEADLRFVGEIVFRSAAPAKADAAPAAQPASSAPAHPTLD